MPVPDPAADLDLLRDAAIEAGKIAMRYFKRDPETWDKGGDAGPVTEADLKIDRMLREELRAARPDYGWLSEETEDDPARLSAKHVFVVDPIDGTRAFIDGQSAFSHSLSVVRDGQVVAGVVFLPAQDRLFAANLGGGASLNGEPITASNPATERNARVLATRPTLKTENWPGGTPNVTRQYRPSLAYRLALVGTGRFDGMVTLRPTWEWDIAAGALIAAEGGAIVTDGTGSAARFNNPTPQVAGTIAAGPTLHAALMARRQG